MQEEVQENLTHRAPHLFQYSFTLAKGIRTWQDFASTFHPTRFDASLNHSSDEEIKEFWKNKLQQLQTETEKVSILVPTYVVTDESTGHGEEANNDSCAKRQQELKDNPKVSKAKGKKTANTSSTPVDKRIIEIGIDMVTSNFPKLDYDYASLFIGNQKQLLIFRKCLAIDSYLQKYRLPNTIKQPLTRLQHLAEESFNLKLELNRSISTFQLKTIQKTSKKLARLDDELNREFSIFAIQWREILNDFRSKTKCRDLILNNVSAQVVALLRKVCLQCDTDIIDRFCDCQSDQNKDILVLKKEDIRLKPVEQQLYEEQEEVIRYEYIEPQRDPQPPKDIKDLEFIGVNLTKHSYTYRFTLSLASSWNKCEGIFIRSQQGEDNYELNIDLPLQCSTIDIDIYPYSLGRISYEIYLWNLAGFTKSTQKIVLFNELELSSQKRQVLKSRSIYLLGQSQCGLRYMQGNEEELVLLPLKAKQMSIKNAALICDQYGDVATWGQLYYLEDNQTKDIEATQSISQVPESKPFRIETPSLLLGKKYIRKVSCGYGYSLMLSIFGSIYSMGVNCYGQLGLGSCANDGYAEPQQICRFTNDSSPFITDILASIQGASFAINHKGQLYQWGLNQVSQTNMPIYDRFGSAINFSTLTIIHKACDPTKVSKAFIPQPIKQIQAGDGFYFALGKSGTLYGWGICKFLGINDLLDVDEKIVIDIVNPIVVMKNISYVTAGNTHAIAVTLDGKILAWGNPDNFSKKKSKFFNEPIDITAEIEDAKNIKIIKAARNFTVFVNKQNGLHVVGKELIFLQEKYELPFEVRNLECSDEQLIAFLVDQMP